MKMDDAIFIIHQRGRKYQPNFVIRFAFWNVCNALTPKGKDEKLQYAYELQAEEEQEKARNAYYNTFKELEDLAKDKIFQVLLSSNYKEI